jgi:hypothetical protein
MTGNNDANKPKVEREYNSKKPDMERLAVIAARLAGIVREHDKTRPVLTAAAFPELSSRIGFFDALDMAGYNYKEQFYEADHKQFPALPLIGSENGHHLKAWKAVLDNEYISGQFLWTGIDYLGEARGWPIRGSGAGLLDTAGFEKIGYFRRKAFWSNKPVLYLASRPAPKKDGTAKEISPWELYRSWNYTPGDPITVVCYTNLDSVELFLNGKSCGTQHRDGMEYLAWTIPFERGKLEVKAGDTADILESTLPAVRFRLTRWEQQDSPAAGACKPGKDRQPNSAWRLSQVELELLDENNRLCSGENPFVYFTLSGGGNPSCSAVLLGIENGDLSDLTEYSAPGRRVYRGRLAAYILTPAESAETVTVTASAEGFAPESIAL